MKFKYHWKRICGDILLLLLSVFPAVVSFCTDVQGHSADLFLRCGAIMALFAAFLEFRTHEIQLQRQNDKFKALWKTVSIVTEGLAKVDSAAKVALRNQAYVIQSAGMEPDMGRPEDIKDMVVSEQIKALQDLKPLPESYYKYNSVISIIGKILVILGTLIWAFGDKAIEYAIA
ncbi:hypothetical protein [Vibrio metoecus]|uniref:hypothetical protein n=1 Tax=Vibrio metoecus TaxID=1481663 RepID=UPI0012D79463|nr:hypothetical protein [Vibrio metoecus]